MMQNFDLVADLTEMLTKKFETVDLSHTLAENCPSWPTHARFGHIVFESYLYGDTSCHYQVTMSEHTGTHIDAPLHFIAKGEAHYGIDKVPLSNLFGRAVTIDATYLPPNGLLTKSKVIEWENSQGPLKSGDIVLVRFGWDRYWAERPNDAQFLKDWPGVGADAAEYFVTKEVRAVGTDALSLDAYNSGNNPVHNILLGNQVLILENLNNLDLLSPYAFVMAFPLKIKDGSGSPLRVVAFIPKNP
jgi:kynurenine formamidase